MAKPNIDATQVKKALNVGDNIEIKTEVIPETKPTKSATITQVRTSVKVTPKGSYSSAEFEMTAQLNAEGEAVAQVSKALQQETLKHAISLSKDMINEMAKEQLL